MNYIATTLNKCGGIFKNPSTFSTNKQKQKNKKRKTKNKKTKK